MDVLAIIGSVLLGISPIVASIALLVFVILAFVELRRIRKHLDGTLGSKEDGEHER